MPIHVLLLSRMVLNGSQVRSQFRGRAFWRPRRIFRQKWNVGLFEVPCPPTAR